MRTLTKGYERIILGCGDAMMRLILASNHSGWWYEDKAPAKCFAPEPFKEGQWIRHKGAPKPNNAFRFTGDERKGLRPEWVYPIWPDIWEPCAPPRSAWPNLYPGDRVRLVENPCGPGGVPGEGLRDEGSLPPGHVFDARGTSNDRSAADIAVSIDGARVWPWNLERVES